MKISLLKHTSTTLADTTTPLKTFKGGMSLRAEDLVVSKRNAITGIATNKVSYPIREIMSNAWDANRKEPFLVHFPTSEEPWFSVRDFGSGIRPEKYQNYVMIGRSTKRNSVTQVGCLGYGSKSPYAYLLSSEQTPEYTVTSITDGVKRIYLHSLTPEYDPTATLLAEMPTDERSGLEVSWPVAFCDISEVANAAIRILDMFPAPFSNSQIVLNKNISMYPTGSDTVYVRMGCVAYPTRYNFPVGLIVDVPIGAVSITPSRESLGYDDATVNFLRELHEGLRDQITEYVDAAVAKGPTPYQGLMSITPNLRQFTSLRVNGETPPTPQSGTLTWAKSGTTRMKERITLASGEFNHLLQVWSGPKQELIDFGYKVIDLTTIVLPKLVKGKGKYPRKVFRLDAEGVLVPNVETVEASSDLLYVFGSKTKWSGLRYYAFAFERTRLFDKEFVTVLKEFPNIKGIVVSPSASDPLRSSLTPLGEFILANTAPPPDIQKLPYEWGFGAAKINRLRDTLSDVPFVLRLFNDVVTTIECQKANAANAETYSHWHSYHPQKTTSIKSEDVFSPLQKLFIEQVYNLSYYSSFSEWDKFALERLNEILSTQNLSGSCNDCDPSGDTVDIAERLPLSVAA
jgi:hypothetical protein